jgi:hypothetical protein
MKKDLLLSLAAIEAAPQRSEGIADSAVQMFIIDLWLMLLKKIIDSSYGWWGHQPLKKGSSTIRQRRNSKSYLPTRVKVATLSVATFTLGMILMKKLNSILLNFHNFNYASIYSF